MFSHGWKRWKLSSRHVQRTVVFHRRLCCLVTLQTYVSDFFSYFRSLKKIGNENMKKKSNPKWEIYNKIYKCYMIAFLHIRFTLDFYHYRPSSIDMTIAVNDGRTQKCTYIMKDHYHHLTPQLIKATEWRQNTWKFVFIKCSDIAVHYCYDPQKFTLRRKEREHLLLFSHLFLWCWRQKYYILCQCSSKFLYIFSS